MNFLQVLWMIILLFPTFPCQSYKVTDQVFFDIAINEQPVGRIVIGLFADIVPRTCENFKILATEGINGRNYTESIFHRVIPRFLIQGGDILHNDGSGSISIYGDQFEDENFDVQHAAAGYVSMANSGPDSNGCQFFITTISTPWLDGKHVVFGKVIKGQAIVHKIERLKTDINDRPLLQATIIKSGIIPTFKPFYTTHIHYSLWTWVKEGSVPLSFSFAILVFFHWVIRRLDNYRPLIKED